MHPKQRFGVAFLALVLVIGGILMAVTAAIGELTLSNLNSNQSTRFSAEALSVAKAGALDGMMRVVYDKNFSSACYNIPVGTRTAYIVVSKDLPLTGETSIYSKASILQRTVTLYSLLSVDSATGLVNLVSTVESTSTVVCP